jgi:L-fuculose-phosphate aldolase
MATVGGSRLDRERQRVAAAARRLAAEGLVTGTAGNISERAGELVAVTPTGGELGSLTPEQVVVVDLDGEHVDGDLLPTSELALHLGVYRRYEAGAVVHTHAPFATALGCVLEDELPVVHYTLLALGGPVRVAPYATFGTSELAELTLSALEDRAAALMANHGSIVLGPDLDAAMAGSALLEWGCELYWRAAAIGTPRALDAGQRTEFVEAVVARGYGSTQRISP